MQSSMGSCITTYTAACIYALLHHDKCEYTAIYACMFVIGDGRPQFKIAAHWPKTSGPRGIYIYSKVCNLYNIHHIIIRTVHNGMHRLS
jgi:hypothetical protein